MTKYNLSEIMRDAWERFRSPFMFQGVSGRERFSKCLKSAWGNAKALIGKAEQELFYAAQNAVKNAMSQIDQLRQEINLLQFKSSRINIAEKRKSLEAQIERLAA